MRPIFGSETKACVNCDYGSIPWDVENDRVLDYTGEAGRLYAQALEENDMTYPDPWVEPPPPPEQPPHPAEVALYDHEARISALEGVAPISLDAFVKKYRGL
jgi:hypothetical protein